MIERPYHVAWVRRLLSEQPVVALLGARQVGKTTLARQVARSYRAGVAFFDLESSRDLAKLADPMLALEPLRGLVVLDEVQRRPDIFPTLRVLADRPPRGALSGSRQRLAGTAAADVGDAGGADSLLPPRRTVLAGSRQPPRLGSLAARRISSLVCGQKLGRKLALAPRPRLHLPRTGLAPARSPSAKHDPAPLLDHAGPCSRTDS